MICHIPQVKALRRCWSAENAAIFRFKHFFYLVRRNEALSRIDKDACNDSHHMVQKAVPFQNEDEFIAVFFHRHVVQRADFTPFWSANGKAERDKVVLPMNTLPFFDQRNVQTVIKIHPAIIPRKTHSVLPSARPNSGTLFLPPKSVHETVSAPASLHGRVYHPELRVQRLFPVCSAIFNSC